MTSCAVVSMTFHGKYGYIRLLRYLASPYILYRLGKRVTQRTLVTLNVFLRKTAHLNPLHPLSGGFRDCPSRSLRDVLFALLSASAIFGFAIYTVSPRQEGDSKNFGHPQRLSSKDCPSKPPAPPIRGISRLPVAVPAGRFICIALGFCVYLPVISADNIRYA